MGERIYLDLDQQGKGGLECWEYLLGIGGGERRGGEQYCGCVYQCILKLLVALEELGAQEGGIADGGEEGDVELEVGGEVGEGEGGEGHYYCLDSFV